MSTAIPTIEVSGVTKMFGERADVKALDDVNLTIRKGEFVSIVGPSGCGKSTLLYALGGFIAPTTGSLKVRGMEITAPGTDRGIVFQEYALFPWMTVFDNIAYGLVQQGMMPGRYKPIVERYIELIGLAGFEKRYPRELSGGMKQRVALARTFAYEPDVLLLDEPFGALDAQTREVMQDELLRLWSASKKTVLMVTHDVAESVYLSDRVCVMSKRPGRIINEFAINLDRSLSREQLMVSGAFTQLRNDVWLALRHEVSASSPVVAA